MRGEHVSGKRGQARATDCRHVHLLAGALTAYALAHLRLFCGWLRMLPRIDI